MIILELVYTTLKTKLSVRKYLNISNLFYFIPCFSKTKKFNDKPLQTPGVGEYNIEVKHSKSPQYSIPKKTREIIVNEKLNYSLSNNGSDNINSKSPSSSNKKGKN